MNKLQQLTAGLALATVAGMANAAVDVTGVTTEIATANAPIAAIGGAVLLVLVAVKIYKWVRRAM
jgi:hypothetical protein